MVFGERAIMETPKHGSWPSGHATEAFAIATLLAGMIFVRTHPGTDAFRAKDEIADSDSVANLLFRIATRIADNRTIGSLHFPTDSFAGAFCGIAMGEALVNHLRGAPKTAVFKSALSVDLCTNRCKHQDMPFVTVLPDGR